MANDEKMPTKVAIVTGGSSGIGQAIAIALAREGYGVTVVGTSRQRIDNTLSQMAQFTPPEMLLGLQFDVRQADEMEAMVKMTLAQFGRLDLLVTSAGLGKKSDSVRVVPHPTSTLPLEDWQEVIDVNLTGVFLSNRAVLSAMLAQGSGHIVNICSSTTLHGLRGQPYAPAYCASKFGVVGLTESLEAEVATAGIRVQAIFPGPVLTPLVAQTALLQLFHNRSSSPDHFARSVVSLVQHPPDVTVIHPHLLPFLGDRS
jgi:NAD(P)-dependent dehydrogenase (short-subunit alcohol dehydrogenase family)